MNKDFKIAIISLSITSVMLLYTSIVFFVIGQNEKDRKLSFQKRLEEVMAAKGTLESHLRELELSGAEIKAGLKYKEDQIKSLSTQLDEEKALNARSQAELQRKDNDIQNLKSKLAEEKEERESLMSRLQKANDDYLNIKFQLENILKTKEELEKQAKEVSEREGVSLGTIVVRRPSD